MAVVAPAAALVQMSREPWRAIRTATVAALALYVLQGAGVALCSWLEMLDAEPGTTRYPRWEGYLAPWFDEPHWALGVTAFFAVLAVGFAVPKRVSVRYAAMIATAATLAYVLPLSITVGVEAGSPVDAILVVVIFVFGILANGWIASVLAVLAARRAWRFAPAPSRPPRRQRRSSEPEEDGLG